MDRASKHVSNSIGITAEGVVTNLLITPIAAEVLIRNNVLMAYTTVPDVSHLLAAQQALVQYHSRLRYLMRWVKELERFVALSPALQQLIIKLMAKELIVSDRLIDEPKDGKFTMYHHVVYTGCFVELYVQHRRAIGIYMCSVIGRLAISQAERERITELLFLIDGSAHVYSQLRTGNYRYTMINAWWIELTERFNVSVSGFGQVASYWIRCYVHEGLDIGPIKLGIETDYLTKLPCNFN